ncbi:MAG: hypothetical protein KF819_30035 [Labilithrix sp.]|nr:hypothetical protein [Labilithrix sp.]
MVRSRKNKLAASFVVTVSALPVIAGASACRKTTVDPDPEPAAKRGTTGVYRNGDTCYMSVPVSCPPGLACNPPAPPPVDCPPSHLDAGETAPPSKRPPGKEAWLRVKPHLYAASFGCSYTPEQFCTPAGSPHECLARGETVKVACTSIADAGPTRFSLAPFTYKDGLGVCHEIPAMECGEGDCADAMPEGRVVDCAP